MNKPTNELTYAELSTILAALRNWQETIDRRGIPPKVQGHFEDARPLSRRQIDSLCERLNCGQIVTITGGPNG